MIPEPKTPRTNPSTPPGKWVSRPARGPRSASHNQPPISNRRNSAFTLLELLVVIGIILVLIGLFFAGAKIVTTQAKARDTKTALETCKMMLDNYRQATHLSRPVPQMLAPGPIGVTVINPSNNAGSISGTSLFWTVGEEAVPTTALSGDAITPATLAGQPPAVLNTICVMAVLVTLPENRTIINNLPATKVLNVTLPSGQVIPLIRDGYGNPILFVPGGGIGNYSANGALWLNASTAGYGIVTANGNITPTAPPSPYLLSTYDANMLPNNATWTGQPFFVSAGPDGDVSNSHGNTSGTPTSDMTDDNIYSFQN